LKRKKRSEDIRSKKDATGIEKGRKAAPAFETGLPTSLFGGPILRQVSNASATLSGNSMKGSVEQFESSWRLWEISVFPLTKLIMDVPFLRFSRWPSNLGFTGDG
jgi:hypothetical protein